MDYSKNTASDEKQQFYILQSNIFPEVDISADSPRSSKPEKPGGSWTEDPRNPAVNASPIIFCLCYLSNVRGWGWERGFKMSKIPNNINTAETPHDHCLAWWTKWTAAEFAPDVVPKCQNKSWHQPNTRRNRTHPKKHDSSAVVKWRVHFEVQTAWWCTNTTRRSNRDFIYSGPADSFSSVKFRAASSLSLKQPDFEALAFRMISRRPVLF